MTLACAVSGTPTPEVIWFRNDTRVNPELVEPDGRLRIEVRESEIPRTTGVDYHCIATNRVGRFSTTVATLRGSDTNVRVECKWHILFMYNMGVGRTFEVCVGGGGI